MQGERIEKRGNERVTFVLLSIQARLSIKAAKERGGDCYDNDNDLIR